jgi:hypothetical protein
MASKLSHVLLDEDRVGDLGRTVCMYVCTYIHKPPLWVVVSAATRFCFTAINRQTASLALATAHNCLTAPSIASGLLRTRRTVPWGLDFSGCNLWTMYALAWARMRPASRLSCRPRWLVPAMWTSCLRLQGGGRQKIKKKYGYGVSSQSEGC